MTAFLDAGAPPDVARAVLAILFDLTLKGALILAFAGLVTALLRKAPAATRHLVWSLAVCSLLVLPVLTVTLPAWRVVSLPEAAWFPQVAPSPSVAPLPPEPASLPTPAAPGAAPTAPAAPAAVPAPTVAPAPPASPSSTVLPAPEDALGSIREAVVGTATRFFATARAIHWTVWVLFLWIGGVAVVLFRFLTGAAGVAWLAFRARPLADPAWHDLADEIGDRFFLRRPVRLLRSLCTAMPMTWGLWRPVVLLPVRAGDWSEARRRCVLTHEFAHIKRWDCLTQALAQFACAVSWFNPLVWIAARQMRQEREMACDDYVLRSGVRASDYATHLLDIARSTRCTVVMPLGAVAMARPSQLEGRVLSILDAARRRGDLSRTALLAGLALTAALVLPLAALRGGADATNGEDAPAFTRVALQAGQAYRWSGPVARGMTVEVQGVRGDVAATTSSDPGVEVVALHGDGPALKNLLVVEHEGGLLLCVPHSQDPDHCASASWGAHRDDLPATIDFLVRLPEGVHFSGRTFEGNVRVVGLRGDVKAETVDGDVYVQAAGFVAARTVDGNIDIRTDAFAQASSADGDIHATLGRTGWSGELSFSTVDGDITVALPADADTDLDLHVESDGQLHAAIPLSRRFRDAGAHFQGTLGRGGRLLALHTVDGNITLMHAGDGPVRQREAIDVRLRDDAASRPFGPVYRAETGSGRQGTYTFADQRESTRMRAVRRLKADESEEAVQVLGEVVQRDPSARVRKAAAVALGDIACYKALPALIAALDDESADVRGKAAWALGNIEDERALGALRRTLHDDDAQVRRQAARALEAFDAWEVAAAADEEATPAYTFETSRDHLRLQVGDLDLSISGNLFETAADALNDLDLGIDVNEQDLVDLVNVLGEDDTYARQMRRLGFEDFGDGELLLARLFGVDARYVRAVQEAGYCPSLEEAVKLKVAGIDGRYLEELAAAGYDELPVDELIELRLAGVDKKVIRELERRIDHAPSVREMVRYQSSRGPTP